MYYQEREIDGKIHYRMSPDGEWIEKNKDGKIYSCNFYKDVSFSLLRRGSTFFIHNILFMVAIVKPKRPFTIFTIVCENGHRLELTYHWQDSTVRCCKKIASLSSSDL